MSHSFQVENIIRRSVCLHCQGRAAANMFIPADRRSSVDILLRNMMSRRYITAVGSSAKSLLSVEEEKLKELKEMVLN